MRRGRRYADARTQRHGSVQRRRRSGTRSQCRDTVIESIAAAPRMRSMATIPSPWSAALVLAVLIHPAPAVAQLSAVEMRWDNDLFALRGTGAPPDYDYTQGLELAAKFAAAPAGPDDALTARFALGQRIYTPRRDSTEPLPGERPYAAWLYGAAELRSEQGHTEHAFGMEIGITGPAALGEEVQNGVHHLLGSTRQLGWERQLGTRVAFLGTYAVARAVDVAGVRLKPLAEVGFGTRWSGAAVELRAAVGHRRHERGPFATAAVRQEWVLRDLFLDGARFGARATAQRIPHVTGATLGAGYRFSRWSAGYEFTIRSPEYAAQSEPHPYGAFRVSWHAPVRNP